MSMVVYNWGSTRVGLRASELDKVPAHVLQRRLYEAACAEPMDEALVDKLAGFLAEAQVREEYKLPSPELARMREDLARPHTGPKKGMLGGRFLMKAYPGTPGNPGILGTGRLGRTDQGHDA